LKKDRKKTEEKKQKDKKESKEKTVKPNSPLTSGNKKKNDSDKSISKLSLLEDDEILSLSDSEFETEPIKELIEPIEGEPIVPAEPIEPVVVDEEEELGDEELDLIPEKKGRGRKKKSESTSGSKYSGSEVSIRNKPLDMSIIEKSLPIKNTQKQPKPYTGNTDNRTRYSDKELAEFKEIILKKLAEAQHDYEQLKEQINSENDHGTDDTSPTFKLMEDGSELMTKAELTQLALRQEKYINSLKNALIRIENKTYGICRVTGKLIPKERLKIVPHATLSIDAKLSQND
jgi:RNA polymerase-binding transcription factor DksA